MPLAVLVSFTYNFQSIETIVAALREHGMDDPFRGDEQLRCDFAILIRFRHDRVHTSTYGDLDRLAAYGTTERVAFRLAAPFPGTLIDMRLLQGALAHGRPTCTYGPRRDRSLPRAAEQGPDGGCGGTHAHNHRLHFEYAGPDNPDGGRGANPAAAAVAASQKWSIDPRLFPHPKCAT